MKTPLIVELLARVRECDDLQLQPVKQLQLTPLALSQWHQLQRQDWERCIWLSDESEHAPLSVTHERLTIALQRRLSALGIADVQVTWDVPYMRVFPMNLLPRNRTTIDASWHRRIGPQELVR